MKTIYLAGPIHGCTDEQAHGWREQVKQELSGLYAFSDPMARDYRGMEDENAQAIVVADLTDIQGCDMVLVHAERPTWGTAMEVWQAAAWGKRVVVVCPDPVSPWLRFCAWHLFPTMGDAVAYLEANCR